MVLHLANGVVLRILLAKLFVMRLHTLPESTNEFARMFSNLIFALRGSSWFAESLEIVAI